jgi:hypothetical protein
MRPTPTRGPPPSPRSCSSRSIGSNPVAPVIATLELAEAALLLPSLHATLSDYLAVAPSSFVAHFELTNFEAEFEVDAAGALLRRAPLDPLAYELVVRTRLVFSRHVERVPSQFRVLVKAGRLNHHAPAFVGLDFLDPTVMWTDLAQSSRLKPVLTVKALDLDDHDRVAYALDLGLSDLEIFQVGTLFLRPK